MSFGLKNLVTSIDMFGQGIELRINKEIKAKTLLGGILSIIMIILLFTMFFFNAQDLIYHENPFISLEQQFLNPFPNVTLDTYSFPFAISFTNNSNLGLYLPRNFKYRMFHYHGYTSDPSLQEDAIKLVNCKKSYFPLIPLEEYNKLNLNYAFCAETHNFTIGGSWGEPRISYLTMQVQLCLNTTETDDCAPIEETLSFLNSTVFYWNLYYMNTDINPQNATHPIRYNMYNYYKGVKYGVTKNSEIFIRKQALDSDDGLILKSINTEEAVAFDYFNYDEFSFTSDQILVQLSLLASNNRYIYHRTYTKIQSVLASVGGLANVMKIAFIMICYIFSIVKRDQIMLNKIFDYDLVKIKDKGVNIIHSTPVIIVEKRNSENVNVKSGSLYIEQDFSLSHSHNPNEAPKKRKFFKHNEKIKLYESSLKSKEHSSIYKDNNNSNNRSMDDIKSNRSINDKSNMNKSEIIINKSDITYDNIKDAKQIMEVLNSRRKKYELKFKFCEIIRIFICCKRCSNSYHRSKRLLYDKSNFAIADFLDITHIIQKLDEFDKLKLVLLNQEQIALFNFITKELMSLDEEKVKNHDMTKIRQLNKDQNHLANLIINFKEKMKNNTMVKAIDKKLYSLLNEEFK